MSDALTVSAFIDRYYKPDRLARDAGARERIIADRVGDLLTIGASLISRHDCVTGHAVWIVAPGAKPPRYSPWHAWDWGPDIVGVL